jgi:hypothetical protein
VTALNFKGTRQALHTAQRGHRTLLGSGDHPHIQRIRCHTWHSHGRRWGGGGGTYFNRSLCIFNSETSTGLWLHCVRDAARCCRLAALKTSTYIADVFVKLGCGTTSLDAWCSRFQDKQSRLIFKGRMSRDVTCIFRRQIRKHKTCNIKKPRKCRGTVYIEPGVQYDTRALSHNTGCVSLIVLLPSIHSSHSPTSPRNNCPNRIIALFYSLISKLHPLLNHANVYL